MPARSIGPAHHPVQRIDLANEMALGQAADRRIARHLADGFELMGQQQGPRAQPRRGRGRLAAGMTAANDDDVKFAHDALYKGVGNSVKRQQRLRFT